MNTNYLIAALVLVVVVILIIYLVRRNKKDLKIVEREMNLSEMKPEKHKEDSI